MLNTWQFCAALAMVLVCGSCQSLPGGNTGRVAPTGHTHVTGNQIAGVYSLRGDFYESPLLHTSEPSTRLGMMLDVRADTHLQIETQGIFEDGSAGSWKTLEQAWSEGLSRVYRTDFSRPVMSARIRLTKSNVDNLVFLDWSLTNPDPVESGGLGNGLEPGIQQVRQGLAGYLADLGVNARSSWGATASAGCGWDIDKYRAAIHHTVSPPGSPGTYDTRIRQIQSYHMNGNGWCDVGYHFLVTQDGQIWEWRPLDYQGAHVGSNNSGNAGISVVGCFEPGACDTSTYGPLDPPEVAIESVGGLVGVLGSQFQFGIDTSTVKGHRDHAGASTSCPGDNLHSRLDDIRSIANDGAPVGVPDATETTGGAVVQGVVYDLGVTPMPSDPGNVRLDGATVDSSNGESRQARASDAYWSFEVSPGTYEVTASVDGYEAGTRTVVLIAGDSIWASIGLMPFEEQAPAPDPEPEEEPEGEPEEPEDETTEEPDPAEDNDTPETVPESDSTETQDTSIPQNEEPSDANLPEDDLSTQPEAEGCAQTGLGIELFHLLGMLWFLRRKISG